MTFLEKSRRQLGRRTAARAFRSVNLLTFRSKKLLNGGNGTRKDFSMIGCTHLTITSGTLHLSNTEIVLGYGVHAGLFFPLLQFSFHMFTFFVDCQTSSLASRCRPPNLSPPFRIGFQVDRPSVSFLQKFKIVRRRRVRHFL